MSDSDYEPVDGEAGGVPTSGSSREQAKKLLAGCLTGSDRPLHLGMTALERSTRDHYLQAVQDADPETQLEFVRLVFERTMSDIVLPDIPQFKLVHVLKDVMSKLYRRRLPYTDRDINRMLLSLALLGRRWSRLRYAGVSLRGLLRALANAAEGQSLSTETRQILARLRQNISDAESNTDGRSTLAAIDEMLGEEEPVSLLDTSDDWGFFADEALKEMDASTAAQWSELLRFGTTISGSKASKKWLIEVKQRIEAFGADRFAQIATEWLRLLNLPTRDIQFRNTNGYIYPSSSVADRNGDVLKGLAWCCSATERESLAVVLGDAAIACFKKIPMVGARSVKAGNACISALATMPGMTPVAQLQRLREQVKQPSARKQVESALQAAAKLRGLSDDDLEELSVPDFGVRNGEARTDFGEWTAILTVGAPATVDLAWRQADGQRTQKAIPANVTRDFPDDVKLLKRAVKDARIALQTQQSRIERLLVADRRWRLPDWRARYLDHGLLALISHRLVWTFSHDDREAQGAWWDGRIVDTQDEPLSWIDAQTEVRLWHPIDSDPSQVLAWRQWLARHEVTQPFKQAHREIYVLTDAERETGTYSNRFAAHLIRQHQFQALCQQRGWTYRLQGAGFDGFNVPTLDLTPLGLRAEYWVEGIDAEDFPTAVSSIYLYVSTDQVRFTRAGGRQPLPLSEIPTRVFTEVMRDVDLFVSVCSIGNDPTWGVDPDQRPHQDYWWRYSFGELSPSAETRRSVLEGVLPHLTALAGRWSLTDRFLVVRGDLRTYKIHLGSGNIQMEPNNQYLCIVPHRSSDAMGPGKLYLPFEGDAVLSIILSKALLLADDRNIKDPTITQQIGMRQSV